MKKEKPPLFESEAAMCADFIAWIGRENKKLPKAYHWTAYAETAGWDILLVRPEDFTQVGIEAKLRLNREVIMQALDGVSGYERGVEGPDFRAVLVPATRENTDFPFFCGLLGINILTWTPAPQGPFKSDYRRVDLPERGDHGWTSTWTPWLPDRRHHLPEYVPDVGAGHPAPIALTHWKIQALKLLVILEERPIRLNDFKELRVSQHRWTRYWLQKTPQGFIRSNSTPNLAGQHPDVYAQIKADREKWMPKDLATAFQKEKS